jgi:IS1 family transposase
MSWQVVTERTVETMQPIIDDAPAAFQYCSDGFSTSDALNYPPGLHLVAEGKTQTYSVEGGNADLRHKVDFHRHRTHIYPRTQCISRAVSPPSIVMLVPEMKPE